MSVIRGCMLFALVPAIVAAQVTWSRPPTQTTGWIGEALAYDPVRQKVLRAAGVLSQPFETWEYDAAGWVQLNPATAPLQRQYGAMCFDTARGRAVLFGGTQLSAALSDTWEWDRTNWNFVSQRLPPPARGYHGLVFDPIRGRSILFGGARGSFFQFNATFNDTWEWDGSAWTQLAPATSPPARGALGLAFDRRRGVAVLFGGRTTQGTDLDDTWEWDGSTWQQRMPTQRPPARAFHAMAYDGARGRVVLFGGGGMFITPRNDTWEWDGTNWTPRVPVVSPLPRSDHALAFDDARGRIVLFGGTNQSDTWEYGPVFPAAFVPFGHGCAGSAGTPLLRQAGLGPWLGDALAVRLDNLPPTAPALLFMGFSASWWAGLPLPLPLDALGLTGCTLYTGLDLPFALVNQGGQADARLSIPARTDLLGFTSYLQALVVDPPATAFGATLSQGVGTRIGGR